MSHGRRVVLLPGDLSLPVTAGELVRTLGAEVGTVRALVMCHCASVGSSILSTTVESFDRHYAVNVRATWLLIKAFAEQLDDAGGRSCVVSGLGVRRDQA